MIRFLLNPAARRGPAPGLFQPADYERVRQFYAARCDCAPTPLVRLPGLARRLGLGDVWIKDESDRFGLSAFKIVGALYAIEQLSASGSLAPGATVTCATAGNHGRAVARAARRLGFEAYIYVSTDTADAPIAAIQSEGATVVRVDGGYEDAVRRAADDAEREGWTVVSDTSWSGYEEIPRWIMAGYTRIFDEAEEQWWPEGPPHIVIVQAGVGGLAGAAASWLSHRYGAGRPFAICAEPLEAACVQESVRAGRLVSLSGPLRTTMAGLRCREISPAAWPALARGFDAFIAIDDWRAGDAMRRLARPVDGDARVVAGPSGACGLGALLALVDDPELAPVRSASRLGPTSRALVLNTEGATDPDLYHRLVG